MTMAFPSFLEEMNSRANGVLTQSTHGVDESAILCMLEQKRGQRMAKFLSTQNCPVCVFNRTHIASGPQSPSAMVGMTTRPWDK